MRWHVVSQIDVMPAIAVSSLITATAAGFLVAFTFMGDPFIVTTVGFLFGVLLSIPRVGSIRQMELLRLNNEAAFRQRLPDGVPILPVRQD